MNKNHQRLPYLYALVGASVSVIDCAVLWAMGVEMMLGQTNVLVWVALLFGVNFSVMGFAIGKFQQTKRLAEQRADELAASRESELRALEHALEMERLGEIGRLSASVAHEVRNPLGVMRTSAVMISEDTAQMPQTQMAAHFIRDEVDRLNRLVGSLLDYAKPRKPAYEQSSTDTIQTRLTPLLTDPRVLATWPTPALTLWTDPDMIARILHNMVLNALEFVPQQEGEVSLTVTKSSGSVTFHVQDNGPGVDPTLDQEIYKPFFTTRAQGTGLGLAFCARLADALGATLTHESATTGAHFMLTLPHKSHS